MELERIDIQPTETIEGYRVRPGKPLPFGVSTVPGGLNFSVYTSAGTSCTLVLLSRSENKIIKEIRIPDHYRIGDVYSIVVFDLDYEDIEYGYKIEGPFSPEDGHRFDGDNILMDPYARTTSGREEWGVEPNWELQYQHRSRISFDDFDWEGDSELRQTMEGYIKDLLVKSGYKLGPSVKKYIIKGRIHQRDLPIKLSGYQKKEFDDLMNEKWYSPIDRSLRRELKSKNLNYWFDTSNFKNTVNLKIQNAEDYFEFFIPRERLTSSSVRIFALWITLPAVLIIAIAIIFLKNQTRPIKKLAEASKKFGRGEDIEEFVPSGASEIRQAGYEFEKMRKRILRHLNQRSEMLSGISHDLRTPLTRMKLQLALIRDENLIKRFSSDIDEMEKMLNEYLQFSSQSNKEQTEEFELNQLLETIISKFNNEMITFIAGDKIFFSGRKISIKRCFNNLIENSTKYSNKIQINLKKLKSNVLIIIEDNGPGIPVHERENVFKPFYKIDKSRSEKNSSVGLGLSISSDIIRSHGGKIDLADSNLGGLKVSISLPF